MSRHTVTFDALSPHVQFPALDDGFVVVPLTVDMPNRYVEIQKALLTAAEQRVEQPIEEPFAGRLGPQEALTPSARSSAPPSTKHHTY